MSLTVASPLPHVAYLPSKMVKGVDNLADEATPMCFVPFLEALRKRHETDAHFVVYSITNHEAFPRINKPCLPRIKLQGEEVMASMLVLEYDNPGHAPWTPGQIDQFLAKLETVSQKCPDVMEWTVFYTTRAGARFIYVYSKPVPVMEAEKINLAMSRRFTDAGIPVDTLADWTRLWRLPHVMRDRNASWLNLAGFEFLEQLEKRFDPDTAPRAELAAGSEYAAIREFDEPKPSPEYAESLLWIRGDTGRVKGTDFYHAAKRRLMGRDCYDCIFDHKPLAAEGHRDQTIQKYVGQAITLMYSTEGCRPEHIYALFLEPVLQLENDSRTAPWEDILWGAIGRNWSKEVAKRELEESKKQAEAVKQVSTLEQIMQGMRSWSDHPALQSEDKAVAVEFVERHLIVSVSNTFYLMRPDGMYDPTPVNQNQLIAAVRSRGMGGVIQTTAVTEQGAVRDRPVSNIIGQYATVVTMVYGVPQLKGGVVENFDSDRATLKEPSFRRADLEPTFDKDVDEWLKMFFGDNHALGLRWIAWSLAFDEGPICALSIKGKAGAGKKLLAQGLAECLAVPKLAGASDIIGKFQYGLLGSPFLLVDENWPIKGMDRHPADQFRSLVSGNPLTIERKFMAPIQAINPVRVLFTANNLDVVRMLSGNRDLSPEDREALAIRLMHFDIGQAATDFLKDKGGNAFTAQPGKRWIRGDGGEASDNVVAKHFLYLYSIRRQLGQPDGRFLVEGNASQEVLFELRTGAGSSPLVIECLLRMLERPGTRWDGMAIVNDRLFVLPNEVLKFFRDNVRDGAGDRLTAAQIANVFRGLAAREFPTPFVLKGREEMGKRQWIQLDTAMLLKVARQGSLKCGELEQIEQKSQENRSKGVPMDDITSILG